MSESPTQLLKRGLSALAIEVEPSTQAKLLQFVQFLDKWNQAYNLTAVRKPEQMVVRHILDSLAIAPYLKGPRVLDVGTGPGLPGIPLSLQFPAWQFYLLDSNGKKTRFVTQAITELGLDNSHVVQSRVESFHEQALFNCIVSRAFSSLADMIGASRHLLARDGRFLLMKGVYPEAEIAELPDEFELEAVHELVVPLLEAERHLLVIKAKTA